uniref:Uncharacterized protein n=1 Tax=Rhabditophanes sp. KR3021 TaxID=114890 RepID=A0AC35TZ03_9BILA
MFKFVTFIGLILFSNGKETVDTKEHVTMDLMAYSIPYAIHQNLTHPLEFDSTSNTGTFSCSTSASETDWFPFSTQMLTNDSLEYIQKQQLEERWKTLGSMTILAVKSSVINNTQRLMVPSFDKQEWEGFFVVCMRQTLNYSRAFNGAIKLLEEAGENNTIYEDKLRKMLLKEYRGGKMDFIFLSGLKEDFDVLREKLDVKGFDLTTTTTAIPQTTTTEPIPLNEVELALANGEDIPHLEKSSLAGDIYAASLFIFLLLALITIICLKERKLKITKSTVDTLKLQLDVTQPSDEGVI